MNSQEIPNKSKLQVIRRGIACECSFESQSGLVLTNFTAHDFVMSLGDPE